MKKKRGATGGRSPRGSRRRPGASYWRKKERRKAEATADRRGPRVREREVEKMG